MRVFRENEITSFAESVGGKVWRGREDFGEIRIYFNDCSLQGKKDTCYLKLVRENKGFVCSGFKSWLSSKNENFKSRIARSKQIQHYYASRVAPVLGESVCESWHDWILC